MKCKILSLIIERASSKFGEFHGFNYAFTPTTMDYQVVTSLIERRNALLNEFLDVRENNQPISNSSLAELRELYEKAQEALLFQFKVICKYVFLKYLLINLNITLI